MTDLIPANLLATLRALDASISADLSLVGESLAEQRRQAQAATKRRKRDAARYALGGHSRCSDSSGWTTP